MYSQKSALVTLLSKAWGHPLTITAKAADWEPKLPTASSEQG